MTTLPRFNMSIMDQYLAPVIASATSWLNLTKLPVMEGDSLALQFLGRWAYNTYYKRELILMYIHLFLSALFPIYVGCHATLYCPSSASKPTKREGFSDSTPEDGDDEETDEFQGQRIVEGLTPSDAALFPLIASLTLGGLYLLIKWLDDLTLLNKVLGYYFSLIGIVGVGNLAGDALNVFATFIFPSVWGANGEPFFCSPLYLEQCHTVDEAKHRRLKNSPLPGFLSKISFPDKTRYLLWSVRGLLRNHWILRCAIRDLIYVKRRVSISDAIGPIIGFATVAAYNISGRHWMFTNVLGFGFCYGSLKLMSTTTFWTSTVMLVGLFVYDIVMVFYTPLMITVATSLDVPIKLVFPGPKHGSMIGLGDIIVPGIVIALALRFDLYLHYLRKRDHFTASQSPSGLANHKPTYKSAVGHWGERFWTASLPADKIPLSVAATIFPKVYFTASLIGYSIGMLTTLVVLNIFGHGQPALLYLVPSVLGALWGTATCRGELKLMWEYSEAEDEEDESVKNRKVGKKKDILNGKNGGGLVGSQNGSTEPNARPSKAQQEKSTKENEKDFKKGKEQYAPMAEFGHHPFIFVLSEPRSRAQS